MALEKKSLGLKLRESMALCDRHSREGVRASQSPAGKGGGKMRRMVLGCAFSNRAH